jgi:hypothetical protein
LGGDAGRWASALFNNPQKINPISSPFVKEIWFFLKCGKKAFIVQREA